MKKKLAAALLAIAMLAASLAGCSSPSSSQPAGSTSSSASTAESGEKVLTIAVRVVVLQLQLPTRPAARPPRLTMTKKY